MPGLVAGGAAGEAAANGLGAQGPTDDAAKAARAGKALGRLAGIPGAVWGYNLDLENNESPAQAGWSNGGGLDDGWSVVGRLVGNAWKDLLDTGEALGLGNPVLLTGPIFPGLR
ncbi:hypothetical protein ACPZ19_10585 [Amycolatopsis lurida]